MKILSLAAVTTAVLLSGCNSSSQSKSTSQPTIGIASQVHGISIEAVPSQFSDYSKAGYNRYVAVEAPNGKSIHILIMDRLSEYQIVKTVNVLNHYLTSVAGTKYGDKDSKRDIANAMANNGAVLKLMNYHDEPDIMMISMDSHYSKRKFRSKAAIGMCDKIMKIIEMPPMKRFSISCMTMALVCSMLQRER